MVGGMCVLRFYFLISIKCPVALLCFSLAKLERGSANGNETALLLVTSVLMTKLETKEVTGSSLQYCRNMVDSRVEYC